VKTILKEQKEAFAEGLTEKMLIYRSGGASSAETGPK